MTAPVRKGTPYPRMPDAIPGGSLVVGPYRVRFARSDDELATVQRLRYEVFHLEMGARVASSFRAGRDEDDYDANCHHLLVTYCDHTVVGTYRLMTTELAPHGDRFYSGSEYDLGGLPVGLRAEALELGRACVHGAHRNGAVLRLLWCGVAHYMKWNSKRYLFGCCSVPTLDEAAAQRLYRLLEARGVVHPTLRVEPLPSVRCAGSPDASGDVPPLPHLFEAYLSLGAKVCGAPAVDRAFKVIDFFALLDTLSLSDAHRETFFRERGWT